MLLLKTIRHDTIWGGPKIERYTGVAGQHTGHLYSLYCREDMSNEILNGPWRGRTLNDVFPLFRNQFGMADCERFPLTLALTEADQNLSIQVHPDDQMAEREAPGTRGKRESWYFIEAPTSGCIINGCTCKTEEEMLEMIASGKFMAMADTLPVKAGDYVFVEPGTLHAITAGSLVYEIEQGADHTYRFYDYDRRDSNGNPRELHLDKARQALHPHLKSVARQYRNGEEMVEKTYTTRLITNQTDYVNQSGTLECFTFIIGNMTCAGIDVQPGSTIILWPGDSLDTSAVTLAFVARYIKP